MVAVGLLRTAACELERVRFGLPRAFSSLRAPFSHSANARAVPLGTGAASVLSERRGTDSLTGQTAALRNAHRDTLLPKLAAHSQEKLLHPSLTRQVDTKPSGRAAAERSLCWERAERYEETSGATSLGIVGRRRVNLLTTLSQSMPYAL